jgi:hypothetical protein
MDGLLLPLILLAGGDKTNQNALIAHMLPAMIPGSASQRLVFATLAAKKEIKTQAETEAGLVKDAISAGKFERADQLKDFPALDAAFKRLPASAQSTLFPAAPGGGSSKRPGDPA